MLLVVKVKVVVMVVEEDTALSSLLLIHFELTEKERQEDTRIIKKEERIRNNGLKGYGKGEITGRNKEKKEEKKGKRRKSKG